MPLDSHVLVLSGILKLFTPLGLLFLALTTGLALLGACTQKMVFPIMALGLISFVFVADLNFLALFPVGPIEAHLVIFGDLLEIGIHNLGTIVLPLILSVLAIMWIRRCLKTRANRI